MRIPVSILLGLAAIAQWIFGSSKSFGERLITAFFNRPWLVVLAAFAGFCVTMAFVVLLFTGPRMILPHKFTATQSILPGPADSTLPVELGPFWITSGNYAPVPQTKNNIEQGERAYNLYCIFCHGIKGNGNGPVGRGYIPKPANLSSPMVQSMPDSEIYMAPYKVTAMMVTTRVDTVPIFQRLIPPQYRWYLVSYIKSFPPNAPPVQQQSQANVPFSPDKGVGPIDSVSLGPVNKALVAQGRGLFKKNCSNCHSFTDNKIGPSLGDIAKERTPEFIMNMILNPSGMIQNDSIVKGLVSEFQVQMPNTGLNSAQARAVLELMRTK